VHLAPERYHAPARVGVLLAATAAGVVTVHFFIAAFFDRGSPRGAFVMLRNISAWVAYALLALLLTSALGVNLSGFILGSAVLGVIIGAAAQSSLSNLFAGMVITVARPYRVGDWVHLRSASASTPVCDGVVVQIGALYTTLISGDQQVSIPNAVAVTAVVRTDTLPVRSEVTLTVPGHIGVERLRGVLVEALDLGTEDRVVVNPRSMVLVNGNESLTCDVEIRSARAIEGSEVIAVARQAAAAPPEEVPEVVLAR
jgi:small-conductance mechanosensitive channel